MANVALDVWRANRSVYGADKLATAMRKAGHQSAATRWPASWASSGSRA